MENSFFFKFCHLQSALDTGHWTLDTWHLTLHWTLDTQHWTLDTGQAPSSGHGDTSLVSLGSELASKEQQNLLSRSLNMWDFDFLRPRPLTIYYQSWLLKPLLSTTPATLHTMHCWSWSRLGSACRTGEMWDDASPAACVCSENPWAMKASWHRTTRRNEETTDPGSPGVIVSN